MSKLAYGDVTEVIDRLNDKMTTLNTPASLAWTTDPIDELEVSIPTVLVYPGQQFSAQAGDSPVCRQQTTIDVVLLIVAPLDILASVVEDTHKAILGYQIASENGQFVYTARNVPYGMPLEIKGNVVWWQMTIESSFLHRVV